MSLDVQLELARTTGAVVNAARAYDRRAIVDLLDVTSGRFGVERALGGVVVPSARLIQLFVAGGTADWIHQRLLTRATSGWVLSHVSGQAVTRDGVVVLATAAPAHVLPSDDLGCLELLLVRRGVQVVNLGGRLPLERLLRLLEEVSAAAVVVHSSRPGASDAAVEMLVGVAASRPAVYHAGSAFASRFIQERVPSRALPDDLADAARLLAERHTMPVRPTPASA